MYELEVLNSTPHYLWKGSLEAEGCRHKDVHTNPMQKTI